MKLNLATPEHEIAYQKLCALLKDGSDKVTALEMLAIAANMVGKLVALQDQITVTPGKAMEVVASNIEEGNNQVLAILNNKKGSG